MFLRMPMTWFEAAYSVKTAPLNLSEKEKADNFAPGS